MTMEKPFYKPSFKNGKFNNPEEWSTPQNEEKGFTNWKLPNTFEFLKLFLFAEDNSNIPHKATLDKTLPIKQQISRFNNEQTRGLQVMWIGHSTLLVQFDGFAFLTDPVFSKRCSPSQWFGFARYRNTPCGIKDLPEIDAVIISHDHYDHLDFNTVQQLNERYGDKLSWFVPKGHRTFFQSSGIWNYIPGYSLNCSKVYEHDWWEERELSKNGKTLKIISTPAQHWCQRSVHDTNKRLWCSWVLTSQNYKFFFAGDTGYCPAFKQIGKKYGPFNVAAIPIGAYEPRWYMKPQHASPEEAVDIFKDLNTSHFDNGKLERQSTKLPSQPWTTSALPLDQLKTTQYNTFYEHALGRPLSQKDIPDQPPEDELNESPNVDSRCKFIGIHWGTFKQMGCFEYYLEPPKLVQQAMANMMIPSSCFVPMHHGEVKTISSDGQVL